MDRCEMCGARWNLGDNQWIKITDDPNSLPNPDKHVLVSGDEGVFRAYRDTDDKYPSWQCYPIGSYAGDGCVFGIKYWMPLPKPPKE